MEIILNNNSASYLFYNNKDYPTRTKLNLPFSEGFRLSRLNDSTLIPEEVNYDPSLFKDKKFFNFVSDADPASGWGNVTIGLIKSSPEYNVALAGRMFNVNESLLSMAQKRELNQAGAAIWHEQPKGSWMFSPFKKNIGIVPFETTLVPPSWIPRINKFDALFVPCKQNVQAFRDSGVTVPIEVIHWGVDPSIYHELQRPERNVFTFGIMGSLSVRKGIDVLIKAFKEEFGENEPVRLICKTSNYVYTFGAKDKRIKEMLGPSTYDELMNEFFKQIDCFVFPTRGEGFGLPPLEAMATGVPAIVTGWSGPEEYMNNEVGWTIDSHLVNATAFTKEVYKEECGQWAEPSVEHLRKHLREAFENQARTREMGKKAAEYVRQNWTWEKQVPLFHEALKRHL